MNPKISVVIGFRDWGLHRVELAVRSIQFSFGRFSGEVILSDYGSSVPEENKELADRLGLKYIYSEDEVWSRSRALNAGMSVAEGDLLVSTDADMIFSPTTFERICEIFDNDPGSAYFLQCRDLPDGMDDEVVREKPDDWKLFERVSRLRPRWGMGGMMAISREGFARIRGFDERLHTYGGEDIDFARRALRAGYRTNWIEDPQVRMYHVWHPPTRREVEKTQKGAAAIEFNRNIYYNDKTPVRNWMQWRHPLPDAPPIVTVAICTKNRSQLLRETLKSVLLQTVQDFEVVVVDDGGDDDAESITKELSDPRIRYVWIEGKGISGARNVALDMSRGQYTAVIDDDDLMHPRRLEWHLESLVPETRGNVGAFLNFQDDSGESVVFISKIPSIETSIDTGGAPGHGTWFVETAILRQFRYDESITSGVDNNLWLRMLRAGVRFGHTGKAVTLRRMHELQVTETDTTSQGAAALASHRYFAWMVNPWEVDKIVESRKGSEYPVVDREQLSAEARPYLPDRLVTRDLSIELDGAAVDETFDGEFSALSVWIDDDLVRSGGKLANATYADMQKLRDLRIQFTAHERAPGAEVADEAVSTPTLFELLTEVLSSERGLVGDYLALIDPHVMDEYESHAHRTACEVRLQSATGIERLGADLVSSELAGRLLHRLSAVRFIGQDFVREETCGEGPA